MYKTHGHVCAPGMEQYLENIGTSAGDLSLFIPYGAGSNPEECTWFLTLAKAIPQDTLSPRLRHVAQNQQDKPCTICQPLKPAASKLPTLNFLLVSLLNNQLWCNSTHTSEPPTGIHSNKSHGITFPLQPEKLQSRPDPHRGISSCPQMLSWICQPELSRELSPHHVGVFLQHMMCMPSKSMC